jgi:hypothetical protein
MWPGVCATDPGVISARVLEHAGVDVRVGVETGSMTSRLVYGLRSAGLDVPVSRRQEKTYLATAHLPCRAAGGISSRGLHSRCHEGSFSAEVKSERVAITDAGNPGNIGKN